MMILHKRIGRLGSLAMVAALAVMITAGSALWLPAGNLSAQDAADNNDAELLAAALAVVSNASALAIIGSEQSHFGMTPDAISASAQAVTTRKTALFNNLDTLNGKGHDDRVERIRDLANRMADNTDSIVAGRPQVLQALGENVAIGQQLLDEGLKMEESVVTSEDNLFYHLMTTGLPHPNLQRGDAKDYEYMRSFHDEVLRYDHTKSLGRNAIAVFATLGAMVLLDEPSFLGFGVERHSAFDDRARQALKYMSVNGGSELEPRLIPLVNRMLDFGGPDFYEDLGLRLTLVAAERQQIAENAQLIRFLLDEIDALAAEVQGREAPTAPAMPEEDRGVPGVTDDAITFGQSAAFSGPAEALGKGMNLGIQAAFEEANRAGGVHGRELKLTTLDDRYESQIAFNNTLQLIGSGQVFGLIGEVGTPTSRAANPLARAAGAPFIAPFTGAQFLRGSEQNNVVNLRASYYQETEEMVARLVEEGVQRVAVLYQSDTYGLDGLEGVKRALAKRDLEPVASWYYQRNSSAVKSAVFRIAESGPEAVIVIGAYEPAARAIELLRSRLEPDPIFMAVSFVGSNALADELGETGDGVYVTQVVPLPDNESLPVVARYRAALAAVDPDAEPGFISLEGYLAGRLALAGLDVCGTDVSRVCFLNALRNVRPVDIDGLLLRYGPNDNQGSDEVILTVLGADGNYREVNRVTRAP